MYNNSNKAIMNIKRRDVFYADLGVGTGCEQGGIRPCLCIQNDIGNKYSPTIVVLPSTSQVKNELPTHVKASFHKTSIILAEQIRTISKERIQGEVICTIDETTMKQVESAMLLEQGIDIESMIRRRVSNVVAIKEKEYKIKEQKLLQNNEKIIVDRIRIIKETEAKEQEIIKRKIIEENELKIRRYIKIKIQSIKAVDKAIFDLSIEDSKGLLSTRKLMISELKKLCKNNILEYNSNIYNEGEIDCMIINRKNGVSRNVIGGQLY